MTFTNNNSGDPAAQAGQPNQEATNQDQGAGVTGQGIDQQSFLELQKRDEHAQRHIQHLEGENAGMRDDITRMSEELEEIRNKLAAQKKIEDLVKGSHTSAQAATVQQQEQSMTEAFDPSKVEELVNKKLEEHSTNAVKENNYKAAVSSLSSMFADKTDEHVARVAKDNGLSVEGAIELSKNNPTMFNNIFINPYKDKGQSPVSSYKGSTGSVPSGQPEITQEYWNNMRRDPKTRDKYWSVPVQKQYHAWVREQNKNK